jgi:hypothetical protein
MRVKKTATFVFVKNEEQFSPGKEHGQGRGNGVGGAYSIQNSFRGMMSITAQGCQKCSDFDEVALHPTRSTTARKPVVVCLCAVTSGTAEILKTERQENRFSLAAHQ